MNEGKQHRCKACKRVGTASFRKDGPFYFCANRTRCDYRRYLSNRLPDEQVISFVQKNMRRGVLLPTSAPEKERSCSRCGRIGQRGFTIGPFGPYCTAEKGCRWRRFGQGAATKQDEEILFGKGGRTKATNMTELLTELTVPKEIQEETKRKRDAGLCGAANCENPRMEGKRRCIKCYTRAAKADGTHKRNEAAGIAAFSRKAPKP